MPYISENGELRYVSQTEFDNWNKSQGLPTSDMVLGLPNAYTNNTPAGGNVVQLNNTQTILTPNTTNNSPGQPLPTLQEQINNVAIANGQDPNTPLTPDQQAIVDAANNRVNVSTPQTAEQATAAVAAQNNNVEAPIARPVTGDAVADLYAASGTQNQFTGTAFGTTGIPAAPLVDPEVTALQQQASNTTTSDFLGSAKPVISDEVVNAQEINANTLQSEVGFSNSQYGTTYGDPEAIAAFNARQLAQQQQTVSQQRRQINNGDWRVRLRLAPQAQYLYNAPNPGIMQPLQVSDGIIFPYTPQIDTAYKVNYSQYDLTHSNYRGYFYQNSYVDAINLRATFTAQDTSEANYLLAVITFLKSATKMFYGQDAERGSPPPLVYLTGLGEYQFNEHPCLIQQFNYNLPAEVDYVRAGSNTNLNINQVNQRDRQSVATAGIVGIATRLAAAFLTKGAIPNPVAPTTLGLNRPTYVPSKMEISLTLLPVQSRQQVSKQFSLKSFANGDLIKGGFW